MHYQRVFAGIKALVSFLKKLEFMFNSKKNVKWIGYVLRPFEASPTTTFTEELLWCAWTRRFCERSSSSWTKQSRKGEAGIPTPKPTRTFVVCLALCFAFNHETTLKASRLVTPSTAVNLLFRLQDTVLRKDNKCQARKSLTSVRQTNMQPFTTRMSNKETTTRCLLL